MEDSGRSGAEALVKGYNEKALASVLDGAADLIERAAKKLREMESYCTPLPVSESYRREATVCLSEAEELISAVRKESGL